MSTVDTTFLEQLLYRGESETLDFKRDQYAFAGATDHDKSHMLKDILAFANSWRKETAHILIGVEEVQAAKSKVVGVTNHLDDASLQQFVNSKTQRPIMFSYQSVVLEGKDVGVIRVPVQTRPVYVLKTYGIVEKETVYLRRGSSNAVATPDEVAGMGVLHEPTPDQLSLTWADLENRKTLASPLEARTVLYSPVLRDDAFEIADLTDPFSSFLDRPNPNYSRELVEFMFWRDLLIEVGLCLENQGDVVARRVGLVASVERKDTWIQDSRPEPPSRNYLDSLTKVGQSALLAAREADPGVQVFDDRWEVTVEFGDVRPHDKVFTTSPLLLGSMRDQRVTLAGALRGDNLATPVPCRLEAAFRVESRPMRKSDRRT